MVYLAEKHGWTDLYPKDLKTRALIDQWLHWHHQNTRNFTLTVFAPVARPDLKIPDSVVQQQQRTLAKVAKLLDQHLKEKSYMVADKLSLADIALYGDLGQLDSHFLDEFDFTKYPNLNAWMKRMQTVPKYDEAHQVMPGLKTFFEKAKKKASKL